MTPFLRFGNGGPFARLAGPSTPLNGRDGQLTDRCVWVLGAVSLGIGLLSTLATSFAFYWFVKMRRNFRHE
jgi:hypothetical protein